MTPKELRSLAERVESATGPERELDAVIAATLRIATEWAWASGYPEWQGRADGRVYLEDGGPSFAAPVFTASLDAAMSLVPEGWEWSVGGGSTLEGFPPANANIWPQEQPFPVELDIECGAATPALALLSACLRAHAANLGKQS